MGNQQEVEERVCWGEWYRKRDDGQNYEVMDGAKHMKTGEHLIIMSSTETRRVLACPVEIFDETFEKI